MDQDQIANFTLTVEQVSDNAVVGVAGLKLAPKKYQRAEVWYKLHRDCWGQGLATELVQGLCEFCFAEKQLFRIEAGVAVENAASIRVLEKCGFTREGRLRKNLPLKSGMSDSFTYGLLSSDKPME